MLRSHYIQELAKIETLQAATPSSDSNKKEYGFDWDTEQISYVGYAFKPDLRGKLLAKLLRRKMDCAFEKSLPGIANSLLDSLRSKPKTFRESLEYEMGGSNYWSTPILQYIDVSVAASALLKYFNEERVIAELVFDTIGDRKGPNRIGLQPEHAWIDSLKEQLVQEARTISPICAAQMSWFIKKTMKHA